MSFEYPRNVGFNCKRCALCCGDTGHKTRRILLLGSEAHQISKETQLALDRFTEEVKGFEPYKYRMRKTKNGKCVFLEGNSCSIYNLRPLVCRFYPFQLKNLNDNSYVFSCTYECPGVKKGSQLNKAFFKGLFRQFIESTRDC